MTQYIVRTFECARCGKKSASKAREGSTPKFPASWGRWPLQLGTTKKRELYLCGSCWRTYSENMARACGFALDGVKYE